MRTLDLGQQFVSHFPLFESDGVTKRSGVAIFEVSTWRDGAAAPLVATVDEIGVTGEYRVRCTPDAAGAWGLEVFAPTTGERWGEDFLVAVPPLEWGLSAADDNATATFCLWLERDGQRQVDIASIAAVVRDGDGALVVDLGTDSAPTAEGVFTFTCASGALAGASEYYLDATATRGAATWYANLGFAKA